MPRFTSTRFFRLAAARTSRKHRPGDLSAISIWPPVGLHWRSSSGGTTPSSFVYGIDAWTPDKGRPSGEGALRKPERRRIASAPLTLDPLCSPGPGLIDACKTVPVTELRLTRIVTRPGAKKPAQLPSAVGLDGPNRVLMTLGRLEPRSAQRLRRSPRSLARIGGTDSRHLLPGLWRGKRSPAPGKTSRPRLGRAGGLCRLHQGGREGGSLPACGRLCDAEPRRRLWFRPPRGDCLWSPGDGKPLDGGREALSNGAWGCLVDPSNPVDVVRGVLETLKRGKAKCRKGFAITRETCSRSAPRLSSGTR